MPERRPVTVLDLNAGSYIALNHRPLMELRADDDILARLTREGVDFKITPNRLKDSRAAYPEKAMNTPAFKEITPKMKGLLDSFAWINHSYFLDKDNGFTHVATRELHEMAVISTWLPSYLVLRANQSFQEDQLPNVVGDMYKWREFVW